MSKEKPTKAPLSKYKKIYLRLFKYALKYKIILIVSIICIFFQALTNTGFLALIKKVTDEGFSNYSDISSLFFPAVLLLLILARAISRFISSYALRWVARKVVEDLRYQTFKRLMHLPIAFIDDNSTGTLVSKLTYETEQLSMIATKVVLDTLRDALTIIGVIAYMLYLDWSLTLVFALIAPIMIFYLKKISPKLRESAQEVQASMGEMTSASEEAISGQRIVKIFGSSLYELKRFFKIVTRNRKMTTKQARLTATNGFIIEILSGLALAAVLYYSVGNLTPGEFAAFIGATVFLITPIRRLTSVNEQVQIGYSAAVSIFSIMDQKKEINSGKLVLSGVKGDIEFKDVSFQYPKNNQFSIQNINIKVKNGEKVALVGRSGGGKTTILNLIPKFYSLSNGQISIDKNNINKVKLDNLREQMSLVSQDTILFNDSIYNNIAYGALNKIDPEMVSRAAQAANAMEFINKLPNKFNHIIGDRGVRLSGGQKQRIAIARAILKNAPILLLDEATSALDSESERLVQKALDNLMDGRTSIVIAHRLSTVINADKIVVIDQGRVVGEGKHKDLLKSNKLYSKIYKRGLE